MKRSTNMGIEYRNGRPYLYRKVRRGGRVVSVYDGPADDEANRLILQYEHLQGLIRNDKRSMEGVLPRDIVWRPKAGFGAPVRAWLSGGGALAPMVGDLLAPDRVRARGLFDADEVQRVIHANETGREFLYNQTVRHSKPVKLPFFGALRLSKGNCHRCCRGPTLR